MELRKTLLYYALKYDGDFDRIYDAIKNTEQIDYQRFNELRKDLKYNYICATDAKYPEFLKKENCPPIVLFYHGNINILKTDCPYRYATLNSSDKRFVSMVAPDLTQKGTIIFEHLTMAESPKDLDFLLEHMKAKGLNFKEYKYVKEIDKER